MGRLKPLELPIRGKDKATRVMKRVEREAKFFGVRMRREARQIRGAYRGVRDALLSVDAVMVALSGYTIAQLVRSFSDATMAIAEQAAELDNAARTAGVAVEAYQELTRAANLQDISASAVTIGLKTVARTAEEFTRGVGEARWVYEQLGISVTDASGALLSSDELLTQVGIALAGVEDKTKRLAMAQKVLGESGGQLLPLFDDGGKSLAAYREELRRTGQVMTQEQITKFRDMKDALGEMGKEMGNVSRDFIEPFVGDIEDGAKAMKAFLEQVRPVASLVGEGLVQSFRLARAQLNLFVDVITSDAVTAALERFKVGRDILALGKMAGTAVQVTRTAMDFAPTIRGAIENDGFSFDEHPPEFDLGPSLGATSKADLDARRDAGIEAIMAEAELQAEMTAVVAQAEVDRANAVTRALADEEVKRGRFNTRRIDMQRRANQAHLQMDQALWGQAASLAAQGGGKLHAVAKAIQVGQAIMATKAAVAQALAIPPAPNLALAAKAKLLGGLQIAGILATSFGSSSGGGGGGLSGGGGGFAAPPSPTPLPPAPVPTDPAPGASGGGLTINVTVQGDAVTEGELAEKLQAIIEENAADGRSTIVVGRS